MLTFNSFLQKVFQMVKTLYLKVTKRMYRQAAVFITGVGVMTVIMLTSNQFGGGGRSALTVFADTKLTEADEEQVNSEEIELDTEANVQVELTDAIRQGQVIVGDQLEKTLQNNQDEWLLAQAEVEKNKDKVASDSQAMPRTQKQAVSVQSNDSITEEDYEVLLRIVQAEAGICDDVGKILVANVILNRLESSQFPDSITEIVYQKSQFSPVSDGSINTVEVTQQTRDCVRRALAGEDYSQGALYFMHREGSHSQAVTWFDGRLTFLFQHERHEFFK